MRNIRKLGNLSFPKECSNSSPTVRNTHTQTKSQKYHKNLGYSSLKNSVRYPRENEKPIPGDEKIIQQFKRGIP